MKLEQGRVGGVNKNSGKGVWIEGIAGDRNQGKQKGEAVTSNKRYIEMIVYLWVREWV